jgi:multiple antibiotic resistance protein
MIFPKNGKGAEESPEQEPFIIPLAIPVITGPGAIAAVMTFAYETDNPWLVAGSALCAWLPSLFILLLGPYIKGILGTKGLVAVERLGGMLVCLIGINMFTEGLLSLIKNYYHL